MKRYITTLTIIFSVISMILSFASLKILLSSKNNSMISINQNKFFNESDFRTHDVSNLFRNVSKEYQETLNKQLKNYEKMIK